MPLLAYCILLDDQPVNFAVEGLLGSKIERISQSGLIALCSNLDRNSISPANFQQAAVEFHRVVQAAFAQKAVVPFRFPTWLSAEEMKAHLHKESSRYSEFLVRHADHVQMEARIVGRLVSSAPATSGAEHLRARAAQLRAVKEQTREIKNLVENEAIEWRERETPDGMRLYALVSKSMVEEFREKLNRASVHMSGPWPATEFFHEQRKED